MDSIHAKELLLFDRKLTTQEAQQRGLVTKVLDEKTFAEEKDKICQEIFGYFKRILSFCLNEEQNTFLKISCLSRASIFLSK